MSKLVAEAGEGSGDGYGVYGFIRDLIREGKDATFVDKRGRYALNWPRALDCYAAYKAKKNPHFKRTNQTRRKASNSLRSALLNFYKKEGAREYTESKKVNEKDEVVERQFQMPPRVFESLFRNAELSDSSREQDEQERKRHLPEGATEAQASPESSSDARFDETMDLSFGSPEPLVSTSFGNFLTNPSLNYSADVKAEGPGTHFLDCAFQTQIKQLAMEDKSIIVDICPEHGPLSGGNPFYISLKECLREDVRSGFAIFGAIGTVELVKLDNYKFFGLNIPSASSPGRVDVKVQTSDGQYLGSTVFTYVDEDQEVLRRFIASDRLQSKFFTFLAHELTIRESKTEKDGASKCSNPEMGANIPHLSGQSDLTQMVDSLAIDDLDKSSGCSFPFEESGGLDTAGSTREASESFSSHEETEISLSMSNKDEACKDENSAPDQCRQVQYSREAGENIRLESDEIPGLEGVVDEILPVSGSVEGDYRFCIVLTEPLPDNVSSGMAEFEGVETAALLKSNSFNLSGFAPAASSPGMVAVKVQTSDGQYLGATVFTYVDGDQEVLRRLITSDRLKSKFFTFLAHELAIRESKTKQDGASKCSNPEMGANIPHLSGQSDLTQMKDGLAIDDLDKSSGRSLPIEERGGLGTAESTRGASESFRSHKETEISLNMGNKDEACKDENSASDLSRRAQYSREGDKSMLPIAKDWMNE